MGKEKLQGIRNGYLAVFSLSVLWDICAFSRGANISIAAFGALVKQELSTKFAPQLGKTGGTFWGVAISASFCYNKKRFVTFLEG